jgi:transcriptional regulator with XRE-family HTH domain
MARPRKIETPDEKFNRIRHLILVRAIRTALGLSQRNLSKVVGVHYSAIARFESGHLRLKHDHISRILEYFQKAGAWFEEADDGDLLIHLSGDGLRGLARIDYAHDDGDLTPRFRL